ncbi:hypothetical protein U1Q18_037851 [Sarracenia purpurea var. burkii]
MIWLSFSAKESLQLGSVSAGSFRLQVDLGKTGYMVIMFSDVLSGAYEVCARNVGWALKRETKLPVSACNGRSEGLDVRSKRGLRGRDFFEEGRQLEEIAVRALNQAKQGIKPLSKGDVMYFETWLAKYRASSQIAPHSIPSAAKTTAGNEVFLFLGIPDARATELGSSSDVPFSDKNCSQSGVSESGKGDSCDDGVAGDGDSEKRMENAVSTVSCSVDVSTQENLRIGAQCRDFSSAQEVFVKMPQQDSHEVDAAAVSRKGRKDLNVKEGGTNQPWVQSQGAANVPTVFDAQSKPNRGLNWAIIVAA